MSFSTLDSRQIFFFPRLYEHRYLADSLSDGPASIHYARDLEMTDQQRIDRALLSAHGNFDQGDLRNFAQELLQQRLDSLVQRKLLVPAIGRPSEGGETAVYGLALAGRNELRRLNLLARG
jgi:hypothetical protein